MTDELRSLLDRLQKDGVDAGRQKAQVVVQEAERQASRILAEARAEAARQLELAKAEADAMFERTKASLGQAARDLLLVFGRRLEVLVQRLVAERTTSALDTATVVKLADRLIEAFVQHGRATGPLDLVVGPEQKKVLTDATLALLRQKLQHGITLHVHPGVGPGFQIRMGDGGVTHDFTAAAIAAALADLVTPQVAAIVLEAAVEPTGAHA